MEAKELKFANDEDSKLTMRVANGDKLESKSLSQLVVWKMQSWQFQFKLTTLKLPGGDTMIGINWMSQFGPITLNFVQGYVQFKSNGESGGIEK